MGFNLGIYDKDRAYVVGLSEYINRQNGLSIRAKAFTNQENLEEHILDNSVDIILMGEKVQTQIKKLPVIYISEDKDFSKKDCCIYKYQNLRDITWQIQDYAKIKLNKECRNQEICCVFSPVGRCGKTRFAKALAAYYANSIYLGLEDYAPSDVGTFKEEYPYYLTRMDNRLLQEIELADRDERGCRYVYLADSCMDAVCIGEEQIKWLINSIAESGKDRAVVFDMGQVVLSDPGILNLFDVIYVPVIEDDVSRKKLERFVDILRKNGMEHILHRLRYIHVPDKEKPDVEYILKEEFA